jgi:CheY-like chemotaxis protein
MMAVVSPIGQPRRILVIDDEPDATLYLTTLLEDEGYEVRAAADGGEGLARLRDEPFDLVLLDVQMPGQTGPGLYVELRREERFRRVPVIIVTGVADFTLFDEACRPVTPPAAILEKPVEREPLLAAVRRALEVAST